MDQRLWFKLSRTLATDITPHGLENTLEGSTKPSNGGLTDGLFERFQCAAALNEMRSNISNF